MSTSQRIAPLLVVLLTAACSRQQTEVPSTPSLQAQPPGPPLAAAVAAPKEVAPAASQGAEPRPNGHSIPLRHNRPAGDTPAVGALDLAAGERPDAEHPSGTSLVVQLADDDAVHVAEWDLATGSRLHDTRLDVPAWSLRFLENTGRSVRLMASEYNGALFFVQLTNSLQVVTKHELGIVSVRGPNAFAGDDSLTVIVADGIPDPTNAPGEPSGVFVMSFDDAGSRVAKRMLDRREERGGTLSSMMHDNLAVIDGHAYVALVDADDGLRVLRLTRDLRTEREKRLALPPGFANTHAKLVDLDGHLVLDLPDQPDLLELSLDLARTTHRPRPAPLPPFPGGDECGPPLRMASELLAVCTCGKQTCLSWVPLPP